MTHTEKDLIIAKLNFIALHISVLQAIHENIKSRQLLTERILALDSNISKLKGC